MEKNDIPTAEIARHSEVGMRQAEDKRRAERVAAIGDVRAMSAAEYKAAKSALGIRRYTPMKLG